MQSLPDVNTAYALLHKFNVCFNLAIVLCAALAQPSSAFTSHRIDFKGFLYNSPPTIDNQIYSVIVNYYTKTT